MCECSLTECDNSLVNRIGDPSARSTTRSNRLTDSCRHRGGQQYPQRPQCCELRFCLIRLACRSSVFLVPISTIIIYYFFNYRLLAGITLSARTHLTIICIHSLWHLIVISAQQHPRQFACEMIVTLGPFLLQFYHYVRVFKLPWTSSI